MIHRYYFSNNFEKISLKIISIPPENVNLFFSLLFFFFLYKHISNYLIVRRKICSIVDMEFEQSLPPINTDTDVIIPHSRVCISNRSRDLLGLPKRIDGESTDDERCSWCRLIIFNKF